MQAHDDMDRRLTELEIKASFQEDLLDQLNQVIVRQQRDIAQLVRDVTPCASRRNRLPMQAQACCATCETNCHRITEAELPGGFSYYFNS